MAVTYESFTEMVSKANSPEPLNNKIGPGWVYNSHNSQVAAAFYEQWAVYLSPISQVFAWFFMIPGWFTKTFYSMTVALEHVYNNMFKLFGFFDYLSNQNTFIGTIYNSLQIAGLAIFALLLVLSIVASFFTGMLKYKDVINHLLLVTTVTAFLPQAIKAAGGILAKDAQNIRTVQVGSETRADGVKNQTLAIQPYRDNVVDLLVLIQNDFNRTTLGQGTDGYLTRAKATVELNNISDDNINAIDFTSWYGVPEEEPLKEFINKSSTQPQYYGIATMLTSQLKTNEPGDVRIANLKKWYTGAFSVFTPVYMRYKVNWMGLFAQQLILISLLISMAVKFVMSVFNIIISGMIAPIVGYTSVANSSKFKELLYTTSGTFVGAIFEIIILRVAMSFLRDFPTIAANGASGLSGNFFDGLGYWEGVTASIMVYAGVYFAATSGNHSIERWLGVSTGQNMGKRMLATAGGAYFGTRAALHTTKSLARGTAKGIRLGADGIHGGAQMARKGVHAAAHPVETYNGIKDKVTDKVQGIRDKVTDLHENSMQNFLRQTGGVGADGGGISPQAPNTPTSSSPIFQEPQQPEQPENNIPGNPPVDPPIQGQQNPSSAPQSTPPANSSSSSGGIREPQPQPNPNPMPAPSPLPNSQPDSPSAPSPQMPQPESGSRGIESTPIPTTKPTSESNPKKDKVLSNMEGLPVKGKFTIDDFKF